MTARSKTDVPPSLSDLPETLEARRGVLRRLILDFIREAPVPEEGDPGRFDLLAREVFRYQAEANPVYGALVRARGIDPVDTLRLDEVPPVPTDAFKEFPLRCGPPGGTRVEAVFRTSGTTRGASARGEHSVRDLSLYRASLLGAANRYLRVDATGLQTSSDRDRERTRTRVRILALTPDPIRLTDSSLAYMVGAWERAWGDGRGGFFSDREWLLDAPALGEALDSACDQGVETWLVGTAFSFAWWLESEGPHRVLPDGSLIVETGGFKGRVRKVPRTELYEQLSSRLGVPVSRIVNEYGMTEMLSQFYEPVLSGAAPADPADRWHVGPRWVRTRILDPVTLDPVASGTPGLLCHYDLANLDSVMGVLTADLGVGTPEGFKLLGRAEGAEPRGCSLAMEEIMLSAQDA